MFSLLPSDQVGKFIFGSRMKIHYSSWMISVTGREFNSPMFSAQELSGGFEINFKPISPSSSPNTMNIHIYKKKKKRLKISPPSYT